MTECCGMMCAQGITEIGITGSVGAPSSACEIKLVGCNNYNPNPTDGSLPVYSIHPFSSIIDSNYRLGKFGLGVTT